MSGTVCTIFAVQISAPCSPCMNWLNCHAAKWRRTSPRSFGPILSHHGDADDRDDVVGHPERVVGIDVAVTSRCGRSRSTAAGCPCRTAGAAGRARPGSRSRTWWSPGSGPPIRAHRSRSRGCSRRHLLAPPGGAAATLRPPAEPLLGDARVGRPHPGGYRAATVTAGGLMEADGATPRRRPADDMAEALAQAMLDGDTRSLSRGLLRSAGPRLLRDILGPTLSSTAGGRRRAA